ncbi:MAG: hypothetical protein GY854_15960 [Deltaproteobacteria bacterium]|nr:hypothetical protein [Deltaproteobacteria bacterium]
MLSTQTEPGDKKKQPSPWSLLLGKTLHRIGHFSVPLAAGIIVGYYISDRGVRLVPTTLGFVLLVLVLGFVSIPLGRFLQGQAFIDTPEKKRIRTRVVVFGLLASIAVVLRLVVFWVEAPSPLTDLPKSDYNRAFDIDLSRFRAIDHEITGAVGFLEGRDDIFNRQDARVLSAEQEQVLLDTWRTVYDSAFVLDQVRTFHEDWYRFDPSRIERSFHLRSFLLSFAAELTLYEKSLRLDALIGENKNAAKFLNSPHPEYGLPSNSLGLFKQELLGSRDIARVLAGEQYLEFLDKGFDGQSEAAALGIEWLWKQTLETLASLDKHGAFRKAREGLSSDFQPIKRQLRRKWLPTQTSVARWMGDTRIRRIGKYLITREQQEEADRHLKPGDILLARKNWYLSNVGLPGFWPHAILYLGDSKKLVAYFDTPQVRDLVEEISGQAQSLDWYLRKTWPRKWALYTASHEDDPNRVIEAISEGVVFNTLGHTAGDYMAALRPRLDKRAKAQAVIEAFSHHGKPYDFDFDFATDHTVVCTELVWRSYRPGPEKAGLDIPLVALMGRETLPANDIAKIYAQEEAGPDAQLGFVYFLDAAEEKNAAFVSSKDEFTKTHARTKWDMKLP